MMGDRAVSEWSLERVLRDRERIIKKHRNAAHLFAVHLRHERIARVLLKSKFRAEILWQREKIKELEGIISRHIFGVNQLDKQKYTDVPHVRGTTAWHQEKKD